MNRLLLIIATTFASSAFAQGWGDWGGGSGASESASQTSSNKKNNTTGSVSVGASTKNGKTTASASATVSTPDPAAAPGTSAAPTLNIPTIGTHYDDSAVAHYEPEYVSQDSNLSWKQGEFIPRPYLRNADIKMRKRVWRVIDLRQKLNKSWTWPRNPVSQVFWELGTKGLLRAYATDSLNTVITPETIIKITSKMETTPVLNAGVDPNSSPDPESDYHDSTYPIYFKWEYITKFEIMEDWVFDYKHGDWRPIIIAIAPIQERKESIKGPDGNDITITIPFKPFWLKMDDCRPTLAKSSVFNRYNDAMRLTWDQHINGHRLFDSYIVKTSDWDDRYLDSKPEYKEDNIALLLESDKLKNDLFIFEHDLWEY